eukprot:CAMPEP_0177249374 /NCGR_PEP_ID=MMETSP0367-20130122/52732_1 /TAXON_ID=447022 ORGANISM="Scrippsiella hangoei-like, Strain SHHI-4" /NCGR_SAMPLE_ID=MMETSP0367 /ASSEMBLY_ACC=CAM_ASM_000362 /LENGTH=98 /DNA_ID=CAMNT_0018701903 /DNA_START=65 /DNA_END=358 /DNA_ORIENTATION=-
MVCNFLCCRGQVMGPIGARSTHSGWEAGATGGPGPLGGMGTGSAGPGPRADRGVDEARSGAKAMGFLAEAEITSRAICAAWSAKNLFRGEAARHGYGG